MGAIWGCSVGATWGWSPSGRPCSCYRARWGRRFLRPASGWGATLQNVEIRCFKNRAFQKGPELWWVTLLSFLSLVLAFHFVDSDQNLESPLCFKILGASQVLARKSGDWHSRVGYGNPWASRAGTSGHGARCKLTASSISFKFLAVRNSFTKFLVQLLHGK